VAGKPVGWVNLERHVGMVAEVDILEDGPVSDLYPSGEGDIEDKACLTPSKVRVSPVLARKSFPGRFRSG